MSLALYRQRLLKIWLTLLVFCAIILGRLVYTCCFNSTPRTSLLSSSLIPYRGDIVDRHGVLLAINLPTLSLCANTRKLGSIEATAQALHAVMPHLSLQLLRKKLSKPTSFCRIERNIPPHFQDTLEELGLTGLWLQKEARRFYPQGSLFSHVIGLTNSEQIGVSGLELSMNTLLNQGTLRLSLDARLQHSMRHTLLSALHHFKALAANAILIHIPSGEVLAMVSLPDFDGNDPQGRISEAMFNRNSMGTYEFGSILKIHNTALLLETGLADLTTIFDASSPLKIGRRFTVTDFKQQNRPLTVQEAFLFSSNIANARMALMAGGFRQKTFMETLGLLTPCVTELPERSRPLVPSQWSETTTLTLGYGYGLAITPLHLISSVAALVRGTTFPLTLIPTMSPPAGKHVVSPATTAKLRHLLRLFVTQGQGRGANLPGYDIGGKTGTANRLTKGNYQSRDNRVSFVGVFPTAQPTYALLVSLEKPHATAETHGYVTAGWIAAPLAGRLIKRISPLLNFSPVNIPFSDLGSPPSLNRSVEPSSTLQQPPKRFLKIIPKRLHHYDLNPS